jgi:hypothetical protein
MNINNDEPIIESNNLLSTNQMIFYLRLKVFEFSFITITWMLNLHYSRSCVCATQQEMYQVEPTWGWVLTSSKFLVNMIKQHERGASPPILMYGF